MKVQVSGLKAVGLELSLPQLLTSKTACMTFGYLTPITPLLRVFPVMIQQYCPRKKTNLGGSCTRKSMPLKISISPSVDQSAWPNQTRILLWDRL